MGPLFTKFTFFKQQILGSFWFLPQSRVSDISHQKLIFGPVCEMESFWQPRNRVMEHEIRGHLVFAFKQRADILKPALKNDRGSAKRFYCCDKLSQHDIELWFLLSSHFSRLLHGLLNPFFYGSLKRGSKAYFLLFS